MSTKTNKNTKRVAKKTTKKTTKKPTKKIAKKSTPRVDYKSQVLELQSTIDVVVHAIGSSTMLRGLLQRAEDLLVSFKESRIYNATTIKMLQAQPGKEGCMELVRLQKEEDKEEAVWKTIASLLKKLIPLYK